MEGCQFNVISNRSYLRLITDTSTCVRSKNPANTRDRIAMILTRMFRLGPLVSFSGSPTVSPMTAALCCGVCLFPLFSMNFLALSHEPPLLEADMAIWTPLIREPAKIPATPFGPNRKPAIKGVNMTRQPGAIISDKAASVAIATHRSVSGTNEGSNKLIKRKNTSSLLSELVANLLNHLVGCDTD